MHGGEDRAEPDVAPDGAGRQGFSELHVLRPAPQVNVVVELNRSAVEISGSSVLLSLLVPSGFVRITLALFPRFAMG
jgi:hypothetical protein